MTEPTSSAPDVFSERIAASPVENPFCPRCEESLQASLDYRANYHIGDDDVSRHWAACFTVSLISARSATQDAFQTFQWDIQAFERSHPLACIACEPKIKRIITERDSRMKERIWADATLNRSEQLERNSSDSLPDSRMRRTARRWGLDVELCFWRAGCFGWTFGTMAYTSLAFITSVKYAMVGTVAYWLARSWLPWWRAFRFRSDRMQGEHEWQACERLISVLRLATLVLKALGVDRALGIGIITEFAVSTPPLTRNGRPPPYFTLIEQLRLYGISCLRWIRPGSMSAPDSYRSEPVEISARSMLGKFTESTIQFLVTASWTPARNSPARYEALAEEMDWEPEHRPAVPLLKDIFETSEKGPLPALRSSRQTELATPTPPSPLDDWTHFRNDILDETKPVTNARTIPAQSTTVDSILLPRHNFLPAFTNGTFRIGYAFSALVRVLAIVASLTSGTNMRHKGFLAEGPSVVEMISSAGSCLIKRETPKASPGWEPACYVDPDDHHSSQAMTTGRTIVTVVQALHCIHLMCRWVSANVKPIRIIAQAANKHGSLVYWRVLVELFWIASDVLVWLAL